MKDVVVESKKSGMEDPVCANAKSQKIAFGNQPPPLPPQTWPTPRYAALKPFMEPILRLELLDFFVRETGKGVVLIDFCKKQNLVEEIIRLRIWESAYWKEECFGLTAVSLIDKAIKVTAIGGVYDNAKPTPFISLLLKLLQIQPEKEILVEYLLVEEFKYTNRSPFLRIDTDERLKSDI
ncbi:hypothetical protein FRC15_008090 [Serendipita sp. 397]|nr:hypothetical protein FRC15_008090 [Serendipita sp. 397]